MQSPTITTGSVRLPFDIYSIIIDYAADASRPWGKDLKALSLTHRSFIPQCQKHLFESVGYSAEVAKKLLDLHDTAPHLADYVRVLSFCTNYTEDGNRPTETVVAFLNKFRNLRSVYLDFGISELNDVQYNWRNLEPSVAAALLELLRSQPSLEKLSILKVSDFPAQGLLCLVKYRQHLRDMTIQFVDVACKDDVVSTDLEDPAVVPGRLENCTLRASAEALQILVGSANSPCKNGWVLDFSTLQYLFAEVETSRDMEAIELLMKHAKQLRRLQCELPKNSEETFKGLAKAILGGPSQTIREITLSTTEPEEWDTDPMYGIRRELIQLAGHVPSLESLSISLNIHCIEADTLVSGTCRAIVPQCKSIDKVMSTESAFPTLRSLFISFLISVEDDPSIPESAIEYHFPKIAAQIEKACFKSLSVLPNLRFSFNMDMEWTEEQYGF